MKLYAEEHSVMGLYIKKRSLSLDPSKYLNNNEIETLYYLLKKIHSDNNNSTIKHTILYNFIRNKDLFSGFIKMRQNTFERLNYELENHSGVEYIASSKIDEQVEAIIGRFKYNHILDSIVIVKNDIYFEDREFIKKYLY